MKIFATTAALTTVELHRRSISQTIYTSLTSYTCTTTVLDSIYSSFHRDAEI